jgi:hypothetical protein
MPPEKGRFKLIRLLPYGALAVLLVFAAPVIGRMGSARVVRTWNAPPGTFGRTRPLKLSFQRLTAYVDLLGLYPEYRLVVTEDDYYAYVQDLGIPISNWKRFIQACQVKWATNQVEFIMPDGQIFSVPAQVVNRQLGP